MPSDISIIAEIFQRNQALQADHDAQLLARQDAADQLTRRQQADLETRTTLHEKVLDVYQSVGSVVNRDFNTISAFLTDFNNNLENESARELGLDAPHSNVDIAPHLVEAHEERWADIPSFDEEERSFAEEDQRLQDAPLQDASLNKPRRA